MPETLFGIRAGKPVEVIMDGMHIYNVCRNLGFEMDYAVLRRLFFEEYDCRKINYIMKVVYNESGEIQQPSIAKMLDFLRYNGYKTIIGETKEWTNGDGRRIIRHNVDVLIGCSMLSAAARGVREIVVFTGSEDLIPVVTAAQEIGARVTLVSTVQMISSAMRAEADWFVDLADVKDKIIRREREPYREPLVVHSDTVVATTATTTEAVVLEDRRETSIGARMRVSQRR